MSDPTAADLLALHLADQQERITVDRFQAEIERLNRLLAVQREIIQDLTAQCDALSARLDGTPAETVEPSTTSIAWYGII